MPTLYETVQERIFDACTKALLFRKFLPKVKATCLVGKEATIDRAITQRYMRDLAKEGYIKYDENYGFSL